MGWKDSRGRPEIVMHPDIARGVASYRLETTEAQEEPKKPPARARKPRRSQTPGTE
jgi:hypothetical protein